MCNKRGKSEADLKVPAQAGIFFGKKKDPGLNPG
jgi:hypothetical protein